MYGFGVLLWEIGRRRKFIPARRLACGVPEPPADLHLVEHSTFHGELLELRRLAGIKYQNVVVTCLHEEFDTLRTDDGPDQEQKLQVYLDKFQQQKVEALALCCAH